MRTIILLLVLLMPLWSQVQNLAVSNKPMAIPNPWPVSIETSKGYDQWGQVSFESRTKHFYKNKQLDYSIRQEPSGQGWENKEKELYIYKNGKVVEKHTFDNNYGKWNLREKVAYQYAGSQVIKEEQQSLSPNSGEWEDTSRTSYKYQAGNLKQQIIEVLMMNVWTKVVKFEYQYKGDLLVQIDIFRWQNGGLIPYAFLKHEYKGQFLLKTEFYEIAEGITTKKSVTTYIYSGTKLNKAISKNLIDGAREEIHYEYNGQVSFSYSYNQSEVSLTWNLPEQAKEFNIWRSEDGENFIQVNSYPVYMHSSFTDYNAIKGVIYYYKVEAIFLSETVTYEPFKVDLNK